MAIYKKLGEHLVYQGKLAELYEDHLELPNGRQVVYDLVRLGDGAAVLPIDEKGKLVLIRQYRNSVDRAERLEFVAQAYGSIGACSQKTDIFLAEGLIPCERHLDPEEFIEIYHFPLEEALDMVQRKEIVDGKTIIAILHYQIQQLNRKTGIE